MKKTIPSAYKARPSKKWHARGPNLVGYLSIVVLVLGFGGWGATTNISGAIIAIGHVEVEQNRQVVQHPTGGVVDEILVTEGARVKAGDVLLRLDDTTLLSELVVVENWYFELVARRGRLEAERDGKDNISFRLDLLEVGKTIPAVQELIEGQLRLFEVRRQSARREIDQMKERQAQIQSQIDGLSAQLLALSKQATLIDKELKDQEKLFERGLAQASHLSALGREAARMEGINGEIKASIAEASGRMIEVGIGILRKSIAGREEAITRLRDLQYRELEMAEKRLQLKRTISGLEISSPVSGAVYGLQIHTVRSVVRPAEPVMYIIPQDRPLVIASRIEPIHIDQVHVGQPVTLRFSAFDQRTTPEIFGTIIKLSADTFVDENTRKSFYRAEIAPNPGEYESLGDLQLLPGMPVESYIRTSDRTPLNYLIKPLADYFNKSFREG